MKRPTVRVQFRGVGRGKKSWEAEVAAHTEDPRLPDEDALCRAVRAGRALMSQDLGVGLNDDETGGSIFAGLHPVGRWSLAARLRAAQEPKP